MNENEFDSFSVCFNILKLRYAAYFKSINDTNFLCNGDKVAVYINFESVLKHLSSIKDIDRKIFNENDFDIIIMSNMINLAAHYRKFFRSNGINDVKVFIYFTSLTSTTFNEYKYNVDFRSYYLVKYNKNPKYNLISDRLKEYILPTVKQIIERIPGVYLIDAENIDSSLVPLILHEKLNDYKSLLITGDYLDTQYLFMENFHCHYIRRSLASLSATNDLYGHLSVLLKKANNDYTQEMNIYSNRAFYNLLFAVIGEPYRNVDGIENVANITLLKLINNGFNENIITPQSSNINLISKIFPLEQQENVINNFNCIDYVLMYQRVDEAQKLSIYSKLIDRSDNNSLLQLNSTMFYNHRLMLEELTI